MRIGYGRKAVEFILENYNDLRSGTDPDPECVETTGRGGIKCHAPYEVFCLTAGEVAARVAMCGLDGMLVEERYGMKRDPPMTEAEIEKKRRIPLYVICAKINRVKKYCAGRDRGYHEDRNGELRYYTYEEWCKRNHR